MPENLHGVTKRFEDFVKCETMDVANAVEEAMRLQWSELVMAGQPVKVKVKNELVSRIVVECKFSSKISFDCLYCYATAKAIVRFSDSDCREVQFRDLFL